MFPAAFVVVLALTGVMGFLAHSGARSGRAAAVAALPASDDPTVKRAERSFAILPPTLAPLMLSGLALFGAAVTLMTNTPMRVEKVRS